MKHFIILLLLISNGAMAAPWTAASKRCDSDTVAVVFDKIKSLYTSYQGASGLDFENYVYSNLIDYELFAYDRAGKVCDLVASEVSKHNKRLIEVEKYISCGDTQYINDVVSIGGYKFGSKVTKDIIVLGDEYTGTCGIGDGHKAYSYNLRLPFDILHESHSYDDKQYRLEYTENQLYKISFRVSHFDTEEVFKAYSEKYGVPYTTTTSEYQNGFGAIQYADTYWLEVGGVVFFSSHYEKHADSIVIYDRHLGGVSEARKEKYEQERRKTIMDKL